MTSDEQELLFCIEKTLIFRLTSHFAKIKQLKEFEIEMKTAPSICTEIDNTHVQIMYNYYHKI